MATVDSLVSLPCGRAASSHCTANYQIKRQEPHSSVQEPSKNGATTRTTGHKITPTRRGCLRHIGCRGVRGEYRTRMFLKF
jgi:hypothetical protein